MPMVKKGGAVARGGSDLVKVGNADVSVSNRLKCYVSNDGGPMVVGILGENSTMQLTSNWNSRFKDDSLASRFERVDGIRQIVSGGKTFEYLLHSTQIYEGSEPASLSLELNFYAYNDAEAEVERPLQLLRMMTAPEPTASMVHAASGQSQAPSHVSVNLRDRVIFPMCVITSLSEPWGVKVDSNGARLNASVSIEILTLHTIARSGWASL